MKIALISLTEKGMLLSGRLKSYFSESHELKRYCFFKHSDGDSAEFESIYSVTGELFGRYDALVFISACGIAVRACAPYIVSKTSDPAVVVIDEKGNFVIPVLSGHLGGANRLAEVIAEKISAEAVITTATDSGKLFSPDSFAAANGLIITDMLAAKEVAAALVNGEKVGFYSDYPHSALPDELSADGEYRTGIAVCADTAARPFPVTLTLVPKNIVVGIGCKRGTPSGIIEKAVNDAFSESVVETSRICAAATIDIKADEKGLNDFCNVHSIPLHTFTAEELMTVEGEFESSDFVMKTVGTDNVCERSAVLCSVGRLIIKKHSFSGVTVAAAEKPVSLDLERKIL